LYPDKAGEFFVGTYSEGNEGSLKRCAFCDGESHYHDRQTGEFVCLQHARLEVMAARQRPPAEPLAIRAANASDYPRIGVLSLHFWDETVMDCFDRQYDVLACPAFVACTEDEVAGVASYAIEEEWDAAVLVMLNVLPAYQGRGVGWALLKTLHDMVGKHDLERILVVTSNDDLPALSLYQRYGFHIAEILPGRVAQEHGGEHPGFSGIPVRDEIRLAYKVVQE
jgi:GNAT superfamily N-acetyltransferase